MRAAGTGMTNTTLPRLLRRDARSAARGFLGVSFSGRPRYSGSAVKNSTLEARRQAFIRRVAVPP